jgi:hypothetical protein
MLAMGLNDVRQSRAFLILLALSQDRQRRALLETASKVQYLALCEVVLNILNGASELTEVVVEKLNRNRRTIRDWADKKVGRVTKTHSYIRHQQLLPLLLADIKSILAD